MMKIKVQRLDKDLPLPKYQHKGEDVGMDLYSAEDKKLEPEDYNLIKTGIKIAVPKGYGAFVYPRSGLALKKGVTVLNGPGVIDPGYRGEIGVVLINHNSETFQIKRGDRIAQLIVHRVYPIEWEEVNDLSETSRGSGGFGHTGQ